MIDDLVSQEGRGFDEEMARTHRRVADVQFEHFVGKGIVLLAGGARGFDRLAVFDFGEQRRDCLFDDVFDDVIGRVKGAGGFALGFGGLEREAIVFPDEVVFEQSFVNRAELLNAQVAEIHGVDRKGGL